MYSIFSDTDDDMAKPLRPDDVVAALVRVFMHVLGPSGINNIERQVVERFNQPLEEPLPPAGLNPARMAMAQRQMQQMSQASKPPQQNNPPQQSNNNQQQQNNQQQPSQGGPYAQR